MGLNDDEFERLLIEAVCHKIDEYLSIIQPMNTVYIAFDGVAPVAKLEQQRNQVFLNRENLNDQRLDR